MQLKFEAYVDALPQRNFGDVETILAYKPLQQRAAARIQIASRQDLRGSAFTFFELPSLVADRCIELYLESRNFNQANEMASEIRSNAQSFSAEQQHRILTGIRTNNQLLHSKTLSSVINALRETKIIAPTEFERILEATGLRKFIEDLDEPAF